MARYVCYVFTTFLLWMAGVVSASTISPFCYFNDDRAIAAGLRNAFLVGLESSVLDASYVPSQTRLTRLMPKKRYADYLGHDTSLGSKNFASRKGGAGQTGVALYLRCAWRCSDRFDRWGSEREAKPALRYFVFSLASHEKVLLRDYEMFTSVEDACSRSQRDSTRRSFLTGLGANARQIQSADQLDDLIFDTGEFPVLDSTRDATLVFEQATLAAGRAPGTQPATVPLPGGLPFLLAAYGALWALRSRRVP